MATQREMKAMLGDEHYMRPPVTAKMRSGKVYMTYAAPDQLQSTNCQQDIDPGYWYMTDLQLGSITLVCIFVLAYYCYWCFTAVLKSLHGVILCS